MTPYPRYAYNARNLLSLRQKGKRPDEPIVVSFGDGGGRIVTQLCVPADMQVEKLDWSMLVDLDVWICFDATIPFDRVAQTALCIARARPRTLFVRMDGAEGVTHDVQVGDGFHLPKIDDEIPAVHEFTVCITNNSGTKVGKAIRELLLNKFYGLPKL